MCRFIGVYITAPEDSRLKVTLLDKLKSKNIIYRWSLYSYHDQIAYYDVVMIYKEY